MATAQEVKDAIDRAVAGVQRHYDAKIALLKNEIATLTAARAAPPLTAKDIVDAIGSARISTSTNNILVPKFDAMKTTPMEFINEVERYFKLQNYQAGDYKDLFKGILPKEMKSWYDFSCKNLATWDLVKAEFIKRFDTFEERQKREKFLMTKIQGNNQPTENYLYDTWKFAKLCYPTETDHNLILRVQSTLHWRIKLALGGYKSNNLEELLAAVKAVYPSLEAEDKVMKNGQTIPPFSSHEAQEPDEISEDKPEEPAGTWKNGDQPNNLKQKEAGKVNSDDQFGIKQQQQQPGPSVAKPGEMETRKFNTYKKGEKKNQSDVRCFKCEGFGHVKKHCPTKVGSVMGIQIEGKFYTLVECPENDKTSSQEDISDNDSKNE
jgi:hypothetical protein